MSSKRTHKIYYLWDFLIFFFALLLFDSGIIDISISNAYPFISLSILTAFACFSDSYSKVLVAGLITGACMDSFSTGSYCFNTVLLTVLAVGAYLISNNVFNKNLKAIITLCFLSTLFYYLAHWVVFYALSFGFKESTRYLLRYVLPSGAYTAVLIIPFFLIFKKFYKKRNEL